MKKQLAILSFILALTAGSFFIGTRCNIEFQSPVVVTLRPIDVPIRKSGMASLEKGEPVQDDIDVVEFKPVYPVNENAFSVVGEE